MSSAKSDKILQESEKISTNPAETGRICQYLLRRSGRYAPKTKQLQQAQRLCIYAIPAPDDLIAVAAIAGNVQHSVSGALHSYEKKRPRRDAFKNRHFLSADTFRQQTFSVRKRYVLLPL